MSSYVLIELSNSEALYQGQIITSWSNQKLQPSHEQLVACCKNPRSKYVICEVVGVLDCDSTTAPVNNWTYSEDSKD